MTSSKSTFFKYPPLNRARSEIRLVCLKLSLNKSTPLLCELRHVSLDESSSYEALSYTWGAKAQTHLITLNGSNFPVTVNLYLALWTLRQEHNDYFIWIDAICVNKNDMEERSHEVLRMLQIIDRH
ncbi:heterokaryon incompatibility protein-domain-containing protein [Tricladium varicosporioides]|nr:heterokaryon incompatibility protein-domain-containing protein [Hymenoscyphus varicosporioides]